MRHLLEIDDLVAGRAARGARTAPSRRGLPRCSTGQGMALVFEKPSARTRNSMEMAVVAARRPPGDHPGRRGRPRRPRERRGRDPHPGLLPRRHRGAGVRARQGRAHGRGRRRARREPAVRRGPPACRRWPTCSRCASISARSTDGRSPTSATATTCADRWPWPPGCVGMQVRIASPPGYELPERRPRPAAGRGRRAAAVRPGRPRRCRTSTPSTPTCGRRWARRPRPTQRRRAFEGFTVDEQLMGGASADAIFLHCLPAHRGEEVSAAVVDGPRSRIWDQADQPHARRPRPAELDPGGVVSHRLGKPQRQHLVAKLIEQGTRREPGPARRAAGRAGRAWPPRRPCRATSTTSAPSRCASPAARAPTPSPRCRAQQLAPEDHLRRVLRRLGGRGGPLGQPRRAAHPARLGPRRRLRARPGRPARRCSAPSPATTRCIVVVAEGRRRGRRRSELAEL